MSNEKELAASGNSRLANQINAASDPDSLRLPANLFGRYEYDVETGDDANVRHWRRMAAQHRKHAREIRSRASYALNDLMGVIFPPPEPRTSTYGLDDEARRKYAAYLMAHQEIAFQPWEIQRILTAPERTVAA